jgi:hypothetical protein
LAGYTGLASRATSTGGQELRKLFLLVQIIAASLKLASPEVVNMLP